LTRVTCGRQDCIHNWPGCKCALKNVAIGKDLTCQNYHQTNQEATVKQEEKSIQIMDGIKLRKDYKVNWTARPTTPDTREHSYHEDWKENVFQPVPMRGEKSK